MATLTASEPRPSLSVLIEHELPEAAVEQHEIIEAEALSEQDLLVARGVSGDTEAFTAIFDYYNGLMLRTAYSIVKDHDLAEDAVQNAIIQAWQRLPALREAGALSWWLTGIVVNQSISFKGR